MKTNTWITSDLHFFHKNIINFCNRPFNSVDEMNEKLIDEWNSKVKEDDWIYHLGDFAFCGHNKVLDLFSKLNGNILLIEGNHDAENFSKIFGVKQLEDLASDLKILQSPGNFYNPSRVRSLLLDNSKQRKIYLLRDIYETSFNGRKIVFAHYPIESWHHREKNAIHLHGHVHGAFKNQPFNRIDVGWDVDRKIYNMEEIIEKINRQSYTLK